MPHTAGSLVRTHRRGLLTGALVAFLAGLSWTGLQVSLSHADEACFETPPGYLVQQVVEVRHRWWTVDCVMEPGSGDDRYTVHRPWQSVRPIRDIDGD